MKKITLFLVTFLFCNYLYSQDLKRVDVVMHSYKNIKSIEELSKRIDYDFKTEIEKARAIYTWLALNIEYRNSSSNLLKTPEFLIYSDEDDLKRTINLRNEKVILNTFKNKKGVCTGYAYLFNRICDLLNIKNELIYGYTKYSINSIGIIPSNKNHVWNAVEINNKWVLIDATYGAGYDYKGIWQKKFSDKYFNIKKETLSLTHFFADAYWQDYLNQKTLKEFCYEPYLTEAFLKHKIDILVPEIGEIKVNNNDKIHLKLKGLKKSNSILYIYSHDGIIRSPYISNDNSDSNIYFKNPEENTSLHIYIDNELALEYKILFN